MFSLDTELIKDRSIHTLENLKIAIKIADSNEFKMYFPRKYFSALVK